MLLSDYFPSANIVRDCSFYYTMFPLTILPDSVCYALTDVFINQANQNPNIKAIITTEKYESSVNINKGLVITENPQDAYYKLHNSILRDSKTKLVNSRFVSDKAKIASSAIIGNNVIIEEDVEIAEGAFINDNSIIKRNTYIAENVIIGARGMQNLRVENKWFNIQYAGGVMVGENCEILAQSIIQRPYHSFFTVIGSNTKISVKVSVGHGSVIGENCMIAGNSTIAGNVSIGNNVWIGPSVTIADHIEVGNESRILIGSVVVNKIREKNTVSGNFAWDHSKQLKRFSKLKKS